MYGGRLSVPTYNKHDTMMVASSPIACRPTNLDSEDFTFRDSPTSIEPELRRKRYARKDS